jgi:hypothetical protein
MKIIEHGGKKLKKILDGRKASQVHRWAELM